MLGKLLKYELKATFKFFIPMYLVIVGMCILNGFFMISDNVVVGQRIVVSIIGALLVALVTLTIIVCINRFRNNLLGDEGYLMFTIPIKTYKIILSKYICSILWITLTFLVTSISYFILMLQQSSSIGAIYGEGVTLYIDDKIISFTELAQTNKDYIIIVFVLVLIMSLISIIIFTVYNSLAIAQLPIFSKYKNIASILIFLFINIIIKGINVFINGIGARPDISNLEFIGAFTKVMTIGILQNLSIIIILFITLNYTLTKKLNLD
ncbi:MAG: hypothetical protein RR942_10230 [Romboutsia sp.]